MKKKKLQLKQLKVKSFVTVLPSNAQKTSKGGYVDYSYQHTNFDNNWTTVKTQRIPAFDGGGVSGFPYNTKQP
ncbi:MAG TPA: hypothetical protein ENJ45_02875 [Phaeodactylibacter sp.]|nr:hypothetical protein [Phaeodactylibacter sp.]